MPEERITISQNTLRAELAEMELRLRVWIAEEMEKKANVSALADLASRVAVMETLVADPRIREMIRTQIEAEESRKWTPRQRWMAVLLGLVSVSTFVTSLQPWNWPS